MTQQGKACNCGAPRTNGTKCKECYNQYMKDYMAQRRANTNKGHDEYLRRTYNITHDQYETMLAEQNGQCAICGTTETGQSKWFQVDHDHACCDKKGSCGACVRGLLCLGCNSMLGHAKDDPDKLDSAALYVRARSKSPNV